MYVDGNVCPQKTRVDPTPDKKNCQIDRRERKNKRHAAQVCKKRPTKTSRLKDLMSKPPIPIITLNLHLLPLNSTRNRRHLRHLLSIRHHRDSLLLSELSFRTGFREARGLALYFLLLEGFYGEFGLGFRGREGGEVGFRVCRVGRVGGIFLGVIVGVGEDSAFLDYFLAGYDGSGGVWALGGCGRGGLSVGGNVAIAEDLGGVSVLAGVGCGCRYLERG
jgi:hypothetical protein